MARRGDDLSASFRSAAADDTIFIISEQNN